MHEAFHTRGSYLDRHYLSKIICRHLSFTCLAKKKEEAAKYSIKVCSEYNIQPEILRKIQQESRKYFAKYSNENFNLTQVTTFTQKYFAKYRGSNFRREHD